MREIDLLAKKDGNVYAIECKFRSNAKASNNVKVPFYKFKFFRYSETMEYKFK